MRREPDKRDAFSTFAVDAPSQVAQARFAFSRVWSMADPLYVHQLAVTPEVAEIAVGPADPVMVPPGAIETLEAWQPSTRH